MAVRHRQCRFVRIAALACLTVCAIAQQPKASLASPDLRLTMSASQANSRGLPRIITLKITNFTNHDVLIPTPKMDSVDPMYGTLFFRVDIRSAIRSQQVAGGNINDYSSQHSSISERIKG